MEVNIPVSHKLEIYPPQNLAVPLRIDWNDALLYDKNNSLMKFIAAFVIIGKNWNNLGIIQPKIELKKGWYIFNVQLIRF